MSTPLVCSYCNEHILPHEAQDKFVCGAPFHMDCHARAVIGSVAHIQERCSCFIPGSNEHDPPGMSKRQAARAAVEALRLKNFANVLNVDGHCPLCAHEEFHPGPRGGAARNIMCASCRAKFWYCPPFQPKLIFDQGDECYDLTARERLPRGSMELP